MDAGAAGQACSRDANGQPQGSLQSCCGSLSQATCQLPPSGWSPKKPVSSRLLGEGSRTLEDLCLVQQDLYCVS